MKLVDATWNPFSLQNDPDDILIRFYHHTDADKENRHKVIKSWHCFEISMEQARKLIKELNTWIGNQTIDSRDVKSRVKVEGNKLKVAFYSENRKIHGYQKGLYDYGSYLDRHIISLSNQEAKQFQKKLSAAVKSKGKQVIA